MSTGGERPAHWDATYASRVETDLSWFEAHPATSVRLVTEAIAVSAAGASDDRAPSVLDVGAGRSRLVDALAEDARAQVTVLDVSQNALDGVRSRLEASGLDGSAVLVVADVTTWRPDTRFDVWHDRAVFHFLTDAAERDAYVRTAAETVAPGGRLIIATFAADGPETCSALPVQRYAPDELAAVFADAFTPVTSLREEHVTPDGRVQPLTWVVLSRRRP